MNTYKWDGFSQKGMNVDYQNMLTFNNLCSPREIITNCAKWNLANGYKEKAVELIDMMQKIMPSENFPLNNSLISSLTERTLKDAIAVYIGAGELAKAEKLADEFIEETKLSVALFSTEHNGNFISTEDLQRNLYYIYMVADVFEKNNQPELSKKYADLVNSYLE